MRRIARYLLPCLILAPAAFSACADEGDQYRIKGNLFNDYRPPHQRANPGAQWERTKQREQNRIDREFEQKRSKPYNGVIDNRNYARPNRRDNDERTRYHSPDKNRHRNSGTIDNHSYGATQYRAPAFKTAPQPAGPDYPAKNARSRQANTWIGPDYSARKTPASPPQNKTTWKMPGTHSYKDAYVAQQAGKQPEKYYGTRSGELLYPYATQPVKGSFAADAAKNKHAAAREPASTPPTRARPPDPSYGGNKAWGVSAQNQVDVKPFYQDDIAQYRKEHKKQAWCKDGSISGRGSGACSGHGGLLRPD